MIRIDLGREVSPGVFEYSCGEFATEGRSRQPLLDACRQIRLIGGATGDTAGLFRNGCSTPDLFCSVEWGAKHTVSEDKGTIGFRKYRPFEDTGKRLRLAGSHFGESHD